MAEMGTIAWLTEWYATQCDETWEHAYGVQIGTLDNPGWSVTIDLSGTPLAHRHFDPISRNAQAPDGDPAQRWHVCKVEDDRFTGFGGAHDLETIIEIFRQWAQDG